MSSLNSFKYLLLFLVSGVCCPPKTRQMSKPTGLMRPKRRRKVNNDQKLTTTTKPSVEVLPQNTSKQFSDLFSDFDFSDIGIDVNANNTSFKTSKQVLTVDPFDGDNKTDVSFQSVFTRQQPKAGHSSFSLLSSTTSRDDTTINGNISDTNKRKSCSMVFNDIDFSDLNINLDNTVNSFQSSRKVMKTTESTDIKNNNNNKPTVDLNDLNLIECFDQPFVDTQEVTTNSMNNLSLNEDKINDDRMDSSFDMALDDHFFNDLNTNSGHRLNSTAIDDNKQTDDDLNNGHKVADCLEKSDVCIQTDDFEELVCENSSKKCDKSKQFVGFQTASGKVIDISEADTTKAQLLFKDIEELLFNDIIMSKSFRDEDSNESYSQKFLFNSVKKGNRKEFIFTDTTVDVNANVSKKICNTVTETVVGQQLPTTSLKSLNRFKPITSGPQEVINMTNNRTLLPLTSTPKVSSAKRRINFDTNKCMTFTDKLNDL